MTPDLRAAPSAACGLVAILAGCGGCAGGAPLPAAESTPGEQPLPTTRVSADDPDALLRAVAAGAPRIELLPGVHRVPRDLRIGRPTELFGSRSGGGARLYGRVVVTANDVRLRDLQLRSGVAVRFARGLEIDTATIAAGDQPDALNLVESSAELEKVNLEGGRDSALFSTSSTVAWRGGRAEGGLRSLRADGGAWQLERVALRGARLAGAWLDRGARAELAYVTIEPGAADALGLHLTAGAHAEARSLQVVASGSALLVRQASLGAEALVVEHAGAVPALGVAGATVTVSRAQIRAGPGGVASVGPYREARGLLRLQQVDVTMLQGRTAFTVDRGTLRATDLHVRGEQSAPVDPREAEAAIVARGAGARVRLERFSVERWPALAGLFTVDADVRISTATVARAAGGFAFEEVRARTPWLEGLRIRGCVSDPALAFLDSAGSVRTATITNCPPGGIIAGGTSRVTAHDVAVEGARVGFGAFGGGRLEAVGGRVRDADLAAVAGCAADSTVILDGTDTSTLPRALCR